MTKAPFPNRERYLTYRRDDAPLQIGPFPAENPMMSRLLADSNYRPTEAMTRAVMDLAFGGINNACPDGNRFRLGRDRVEMDTVGPDGYLWRARITLKDGRATGMSLEQKSKRYPELMLCGS